MTPEEIKALVQQTIREELHGFRVLGDRAYFERGIDLAPNTFFKTGSTVKLGVFGATPVAQQSAVATASGCAGNADDVVNDLVTKLQAYGLLP